VLLPGVIRVHGGQRSVNATGGQCGVGVGLRLLANDKDVDSSLGEFDRRAQPRSSCSDDKDGGRDLLFNVGHVRLLCPSVS
jgi:hypothetical protein